MMKTLLLPFFCDGYDEKIFRSQIGRFEKEFVEMGVDLTVAEPISTYEQAEKAALSYHPFLYGLVILLPITWSEPRLAAVSARAFFGSPLLVFGVNEFELNGCRTENSSAPAAAALYGSLCEMGIPAELFFDFPKASEKKLKPIFMAAEAIQKLRGTKIGFFGHNFNGITEAGFDLSVLRKRFGTEVYSFDGSSLISRMEQMKQTDPLYRKYEKEAEKLHGLPEREKDRVIRMTAGLASFCGEYGLTALSIRCHTEFSQEYGLSCCLPLSILGNEISVACEADLPVLFTEHLLKLLSGGKTPTYADLRTFREDGMDVGACGFAPTNLTGERSETGGSGGYLTNTSDLNRGRITLARVLKKPEGKLQIHAVTGEMSVISDRLTEFGCAPYPMGHVTVDDMGAFLGNVGANHYAIVYDDVTEALRVFAKYENMELI